MLFNSYTFIFLFLPVTLGVYFFLTSHGKFFVSKVWIVVASLFFYAIWNVNYLLLILLSITVNYYLSLKLQKTIRKDRKKQFLWLGIGFNVGLLVYFKYMDFFIGNLNYLFTEDLPLLHLALPLAISFFTLQQIAYLVDVYGGLTKENRFLDYTFFVTFFPQLIAGPIVHHKEIMPQFTSLKRKVPNVENMAFGFYIFSIGLFKKVIFADTFAIWADKGYSQIETLNMLEAWITSFCYTFQLYFDFSGYTDMAIGLALLFNIQLPQNFNSPYKSLNVIEFWQRWHITLTRFITTYVYKPLLKLIGSTKFEVAMLVSVVTMILVGFWHGAAWTFVIFGLLHGIAIVLNHYWKKYGHPLPKLLAWFFTFMFLNLSFVLFRSDTLEDAYIMLTKMFNINKSVMSTEITYFHKTLYEPGIILLSILFVLASFVIFFMKNTDQYIKTRYPLKWQDALFTALLLFLALKVMAEIPSTRFIYFAF